MKNQNCLLIRLGVGMILTVTAGFAVTIPRLINYQGKLTTTSGNPVVDSVYRMQFSIYEVPTGGTPRWTEIQDVSVSNGIFNVQLGASQPIESLPGNADCYLEVKVGSDLPVVPRIRLISTPYAYIADNTARLGGIPASGYVRSVSATPPLSSSGGQNPNLSLNTTMGGDVSGSYPNPTVVGLQTRPVAATAPSVGQVLRWNGSSWAPASVGTPGRASFYDTLFRQWSYSGLTWQSFPRTPVSLQITTTGQPVQITYTGGGFHTNQSTFGYSPIEIGLFRDGVLLATNEAVPGVMNGQTGLGTAVSLSFLDTLVSAGSHTYEIKLIWNRNGYTIPLYQNQTALYGSNSLIAVEYR